MAYQPRVHGNRYMVSSGHILATQAGFEILAGGGNAIDAGVAAGLALGVVHSDMVQIAGVAPIMVYLAEERRVTTVSGLGWWPAAASMERFIAENDGHVPSGLLRTVVPAAPDAWIRVLSAYGTRSFGEVAAAAIRYGRDGFPMHEVMRDYIVANEAAYRQWDSSRLIYLPHDRPPAVGERFVQADLAASLQHMADEERAAAAKGGRAAGLQAARDAFYRGDLAAAITDYHRAHGGWLTREDLAAFESAIEAPVVTTFHGLDVYTCGPWCQGPVLQQMLSLLRRDDLAALGHNSAEYIHLVAEATKLAFADRERYYGDPRHVDVPLDTLLSEGYARARRGLVDPARAWPEMPPAGEVGRGAARAAGGYSAAAGSPAPSADTSYCCAVDEAGNLFSATPSDVSWEGPIIPGTGLAPSSRGSQSWAVAGHASALAPGKRPRLTPNPAIAIVPGPDGVRIGMPFGTPGGDNQTQAMLQVLLAHRVFGLPIQDAIEAPRFMSHSFPNSFEPHRYFPGKLTVEGRVDVAVTDRLAALGHDVERLEDMTYKTAGVCAIVADRERGILEGGADPRRMSRAMGW